jgi:glycosyltransferase involved in cell wall biosynthesis
MLDSRTDRMTRPDVVLYDPDPVNPYGRELAHLLAGERAPLLVMPRVQDPLVGAFRSLSVLAVGRRRDGLVGTILRRLFGPVMTVMLAAFWRAPLVVVWVRDAWDATVLACAARCGARVIFVDHNPLEGRRLRGAGGKAQGVLEKTAAATVVHSARLITPDLARRARVHVVPHPPYSLWRDTYYQAPRGRASAAKQVLLLGALRPDKGLMHLPEVVRTCRTRPLEIIVAGKGVPPPGWAEQLSALGVDAVVLGGKNFLPDETVAEAISTADVLLAPYVGATQSGAVVLAQTCGLPVVGYRSGALEDVIARDNLVDPGDADALGKLLDRVLAMPRSVTPASGDTTVSDVTAAWSRIISPFHERSAG